MVREAGGEVAGIGFVVELTFLNGRSKLDGADIFSLIQYDK
jgi:adenine phosphoribosyltransferase